jgi:hypothetical protein
MAIPDYAAHLDEEKYNFLRRNWQDLMNYDADQKIQSPEDVSAFLMIVAVDCGEDTAKFMETADNGNGRGYATIPTLISWKPNDVTAAMEHYMANYDLDRYGLAPLANLAQVLAVNSENIQFSAATLTDACRLVRSLGSSFLYSPMGTQLQKNVIQGCLKALKKESEEYCGVRDASLDLALHWMNGLPENMAASQIFNCAPAILLIEKYGRDDQLAKTVASFQTVYDKLANRTDRNGIRWQTSARKELTRFWDLAYPADQVPRYEKTSDSPGSDEEFERIEPQKSALSPVAIPRPQ